MTLAFIAVYLVAAVCCLIVLFARFLDWRAAESVRQLPIFSVVELIVLAIVDFVWVKQSFWFSVVLPIALTTTALVLILNAELTRLEIPLFTSAVRDYDVRATSRSAGRSSHYSDAGMKFYEGLERAMYCCLIVLISAVCFGAIRLSGAAFASAITGDHKVDGLLTVNSYLLLGSLVLLVLAVLPDTVGRLRAKAAASRSSD